MSNTLAEVVNRILPTLGNSAEAKLAVAANVSPGTIFNVKAGKLPLPGTAFRIALACGCLEPEAREIAQGVADQRSA